MLVLSRKKNESIIIQDNIKVTVTKITEKRVQFAIEAPKDIKIHRHEIYERIQNEKTN